MGNKIIIDMPLNTINYFNQRNSYKGLTKEWLEYRINIFMKYTYKCLINQTDQDFLCVVHYMKCSENIINELLSKFPKLPKNIVFTAEGDNLIKSSVSGYDYVYKLRLDSDNIIHPSFVDQLKKIEYRDGLQCIIGRWGYVYDSVTNRLALWDHDSSAFNSYVYKVDDYINNNYLPSTEPEYHMVAVNLNHEFLFANNGHGRSYIILVHGNNLQNEFDEIVSCDLCPGIITDEKLKSDILKEFKVI